MADAPILGLHHVTAISGAPQVIHAFYTRVLGQGLVKKTVNFDAPETYHLYYGNERGEPGTAMTFFPWDEERRGRVGAGQVAVTQFRVPPGALDFWARRLQGLEVRLIAREAFFGEERLILQDPDGVILALVEAEGGAEPWATDDIPADKAIRGFHGVTLAVAEAESTARILTDLMGYRELGRADGAGGMVVRLVTDTVALGRVVDLHVLPGGARGVEGTGTVHHVAFQVADTAAQADVRARVMAAGHPVTEPLDRTYFHAIYFRVPAGILFEVATAAPGFDVDEPVADLGTHLRLPPQHEPNRARIESVLPPLAP